MATDRQAKTMQDVRAADRCAEGNSHDWPGAGDVGKNDKPKVYPSAPDGTELVTWVVHGAHQFIRPGADQIVTFFKGH